MQGYLPDYEVNPTTWVYLSSLLTIGIFFKFHRLWSVRNLDLLGVIAFGPGLLLVIQGAGLGGYVWLFVMVVLFLVRLLIDPMMVRRPLLEPNLNASGLTFTGIAILVFLMSNVLTGKVAPLAARPLSTDPAIREASFPLLYTMADLSEAEQTGSELQARQPNEVRRGLARTAATRCMAVVAHLTVVIGMVLIGYRHFGNFHTGAAMASLYLLLPYTAQMTPRIDHVVPAALLVLAVLAYRRPLVSGLFIGVAAGLIGYPLFLLPLWCSFYWRRGLVRFLGGIAGGLLLSLVLLGLLMLAARLLGLSDGGSFFLRVQDLFRWLTWSRWLGWSRADGLWQHTQALRIPVLAAFVALSGSLAVWPAQKNLGTLLSCSAAVMLATQLWHPYQGGVYMGWYLPLLVLTIFRPNLEDRIALTTVTEGRLL